MATNSTKTARPVAVPPGYDLPDKLEQHARSILGSEPAKVCEASAVFIREKICENTDLKRELVAAKQLIQRIYSMTGAF